jgi:hypothetical protein
MKTIKESYEAYRIGDCLTDKELIALHNHFSELAKLTCVLGDTFRLANTEAYNVEYSLRGFIEARKSITMCDDIFKKILCE